MRHSCISFSDDRQTAEQIMCLHLILRGLGLIGNDTRPPSPGSNEAIIQVYAHVLSVEILATGQSWRATGIAVEIPMGDRWLHLYDALEIPNESPAQLVLEFVDKEVLEELQRRNTEYSQVASSGGDRW